MTNIMTNIMKILPVVVFALFLNTALFSQNVNVISTTDEYRNIIDNSSGKVLLVNFWATWCPPCVKEFPELVKLYNDYKEKDFNLVFISLDDSSDIDKKLIPFLQNQGVDFLSYFGNFSNPETIMNYVDKSWQGEIPFTGIYDKKGKLVKSFYGNKTYEQFEAEIKKFMD